MNRLHDRLRWVAALAALVGLAAALAAPLAAQDEREREPERPLLVGLSAEELEQFFVPTFCRTDPGESRAGEGHPKFGIEWCRQLATDQAAGDDESASFAKLVQFNRAFQPFCRTGGGGHPEFGTAWCLQKTQSLLAGAQIRAPGGEVDDGVASFCQPGGGGHPRWGLRWCAMTEAERNDIGSGNGDEIRREDQER